MKAQKDFDSAKEKKAQERVKEAAKEARMEQEAKDKAADLARENEMKAAKKRMTEIDGGLTKLGKQIKELDMRLKKGNLDQDAFLAIEDKLNALRDQQKKDKKEKEAKKALVDKL